MQVSESMKLQSQTSSLMRAMDAFNEAIMLVDMDLSRWTIMFTNDAWLRIMSACTFRCSVCAPLFAWLSHLQLMVHVLTPGPRCSHDVALFGVHDWWASCPPDAACALMFCFLRLQT